MSERQEVMLYFLIALNMDTRYDLTGDVITGYFSTFLYVLVTLMFIAITAKNYYQRKLEKLQKEMASHNKESD